MASIYRRGKTYWIKYADAQGQTVRRSLKTTNKPKAEIELKRVELALHDKEDIPGHVPSFGEFSTEYLIWRETKHPDSQVRIDSLTRLHLMPYFKDMRLYQIGLKEADAYNAHRSKQGAKVATRVKELKTLIAILNRAVKLKKLFVTPLSGYELPEIKDDSVPPTYSKEQLEALYKASNDQHRQMWVFIVNTGLRRAEALNLRLARCAGDHAIVESTSSKPSKSGKTRKVPLNTAAKAARDYLRDVSTTEFLFPRMNINSLTRAFMTDAKRAGIGGHIHMLRHTFATNLVHANVAVRVVQQLLGHATIAMTMRYTHDAKDEVLTSAVAKLD